MPNWLESKRLLARNYPSGPVSIMLVGVRHRLRVRVGSVCSDTSSEQPARPITRFGEKIMPGAVENDELVLRVVEDVIRAGNPPTFTTIIEHTVPKGRNSSILESLQSLVLRGELVRVRAMLDFTGEERASDLDLYYPVSTVRARPEPT